MNTLISRFLAVALLCVSSASFAQDPASAVATLQSKWAIANYELEGDRQKQAFEELLVTSDDFIQRYPNEAPLWIWDGIIKSTYAGVKGGLGALSLAKQSRKSLERALNIDAAALDGSAYTSLGTLYFKVPGFPAGFGSNKKAAQMLEKALQINPDGIDSNYFYADYLLDRKQYAEAEKYLLKAQKATPRPDRPLADAGRQAEILVALSQVRNRLAQNRP